MGKKVSLSRIPLPAAHVRWKQENGAMVRLEIENTGWANWLAQRLFHRPRWSRVELDALGSFVWRKMDGQRTVRQLGELVEEDFGAVAHPLYERLWGYLLVLHSYGLIRWR